MTMRIGAVVAALAGVLWSGVALAAPVSYVFKGTFDLVSDPLLGQCSVGLQMTAHLTFDTAAVSTGCGACMSDLPPPLGPGRAGRR